MVNTTEAEGFVPGGMSLRNMTLPHRPDREREAFENASNGQLRPDKLDQTKSFMLEAPFPQHLTPIAAREAPWRDDYLDCWDSLEKLLGETSGRK